MGRRLLEAITWLSPIAYPDMPEGGHRYLRAFASWVYEYAGEYDGTAGSTAGSLHEIDESRLRCRLGRTRLCSEWPGYWDPTPTERHPAGRPQEDALKRTGGIARAYGAARMEQESGAVVTAHILIRPIEAAVAQAQALRDVEGHLVAHPVNEIHLRGVDVRARQVGGEWEVTERTVHPRNAREAAAALLEQVRLAYVGELPGRQGVAFPQWRPTGFEAAALVREAAAEATGEPVVASTPPPVRYDGARLIATPELVDLIPALGSIAWCQRPERVAAAPVRAAGGRGKARRKAASTGGGGLSDDLRAMIPDFGGTAA